ncbi:MAG: hypothetical protein NTW95_07770 [Candidatus Aminicenantes bacterium]|nr:hypothetical protein [Candidatus Aminicenantes bacterium]
MKIIRECSGSLHSKFDMEIVRLAICGLTLGLFCQALIAQIQDGEKPPFYAGQQTEIKGPYLGQIPPGKEPKIFAPGIVSQTASKESACTFSPDGKEFYFTRNNSQIMASRLEAQGWTYPAPVQFSAGYIANEPHVTYDNRRIYWNWEHPAPAGEPKLPDYGIYVSERTAAGWSVAKYAGQGMFVSSSRDGKIYVTHTGPECDFVSQAIMKGNLIAGYEDLKGGIEKLRGRSDSIAHPCIAPDGSYIVFDIDGGPHLFVSFKCKDGTWGEAVDLSQYGLDVKAGIASISPDGRYLFFGWNDDIYWVSTRIISDLPIPVQKEQEQK